MPGNYWKNLYVDLLYQIGTYLMEAGRSEEEKRIGNDLRDNAVKLKQISDTGPHDNKAE